MLPYGSVLVAIMHEPQLDGFLPKQTNDFSNVKKILFINRINKQTWRTETDLNPLHARKFFPW